MTSTMAVLLTLSLIGIALPLILYPLLLPALGSRFTRPNTIGGLGKAQVSVIVACRNPQELLVKKIANTFSLDWPADAIELIVICDGSTDGSARILSESRDSRLRFHCFPEHRGKAAALNLGLEMARGDILVFTDVDALLATDALHLLTRHFADEAVGGVCGQRVLADESKALRDAQASYVDWDSRIKILENRMGSVTSNDGKLYALRATAARPIAEGVTDDLYAALQVIAQGWRFVFEPGARALVRVPARSPEHEIARRRRIVCRSLTGILLCRQVLDPRKFGFFSLALFVNKVLRRLLPLFLALLLVSSGILAVDSLFWGGCFALQLAGYGMALLGAVLPRLPGRLGTLTRKAYYFLLGNLGTALGLWDFLRGRQVVRWEPNKGDQGSGRPPIAYTMSRFPKLTETFILYEILTLLDQGYRIQVWPLLKERARVRHAEVERVMPYVVWLPFLSPGILGSNLILLTTRPRRYLGTLAAMIRGTWKSWNYLIGGLGIWPKSVHLARQLEQGGVKHLHAHFANHPALAAWIVHRLTGIGYSFTAHGSDLHIDQTMLAEKIDEARFVVTISHYNRNFIAEHVGAARADKVHIVHCGVDTDLFRPVEGPRQAPGEGPLRILCIAALRDVKGHRHLIDACALLSTRGIAFRCELVGEGPMRGAIERQIASLGLTDKVLLLGPLPREGILRKLREETDLVALASILARRGNREGIPVTLMEAMACALPVVSSRISGIPELIEDGISGLLTAPGNAEAIADALESLARDHALRAALGGAARIRIVSDFEIQRNAAELARLFQDYLRVSGASAPATNSFA
jgi:colanic acid/amylovoran biosynthesis glycosyltransferase